MTAITVEVAHTTSVITLRIDYSTTLLGIDRADMNGTRPLRTRGIFPQAGSGSISLPDYEAALTGLVEYRVKTTGGTFTVRTTIDSPRQQLPRFTLPMVPQYSVAVETVHGYDERRDTGATIHDIIGRNDPLVVLGQLRTRRGRLKIWAAEYEDTNKLRTLFYRGDTVHMRQVEHRGLDMYFIPLTYSASPAGEDWEIEVEYVEVNFPAGDIISFAGWTFAALAAQETSFTTVAQDFENWTQLEIGVKR